MKYEQIVGQFWKDDKAVYCERRRIRGANPKTFTVIGDSWAKDDKHVYYAMYVLNKADPNSFVRLNALYGKDKNFAYSAYGHVVKDADPNTFEVLDSGRPTKELFSFKQLYKAGYAKDRNYVFYYVATEGRPTKIKNANPKTFVSLGNEYGRDNKSIFYQKKKIQGASLPDWRYLGWWYSIDNKKVYFENKAIPNADVESFIVLEAFYGWAKDKNNYYSIGRVSSKDLYVKDLEKYVKEIKWTITSVESGKFDSLHLMHTYNSFLPPEE